jgi:hypothetical protein
VVLGEAKSVNSRTTKAYHQIDTFLIALFKEFESFCLNDNLNPCIWGSEGGTILEPHAN